MPREDEMQVGVFYSRAEPATVLQGSIPVEMGGGEGNLVRIWACHWNFELAETATDLQTFLGVALSSNPEHEITPLVNFEDFQFNQALYARSLRVAEHIGAGDSTIWHDQQIVPVYGLIRPRRQIMVWSIILSTVGLLGLGLEVYYTPFSASFDEREEVNRKYGKYRRS